MSSAVVGVMPVGSSGARQQRVDERRLAVVELAQHDDGVALVVELGEPHLAHVALDERQPRRLGRRPQIDEHRADGGLLLVERREGVGHRSTDSSSATRASQSSFDVPAGSASGAASAARPVPLMLRK